MKNTFVLLSISIFLASCTVTKPDDSAQSNAAYSNTNTSAKPTATHCSPISYDENMLNDWDQRVKILLPTSGGIHDFAGNCMSEDGTQWVSVIARTNPDPPHNIDEPLLLHIGTDNQLIKRVSGVAGGGNGEVEAGRPILLKDNILYEVVREGTNLANGEPTMGRFIYAINLTNGESRRATVEEAETMNIPPNILP